MSVTYFFNSLAKKEKTYTIQDGDRKQLWQNVNTWWILVKSTLESSVLLFQLFHYIWTNTSEKNTNERPRIRKGIQYQHSSVESKSKAQWKQQKSKGPPSVDKHATSLQYLVQYLHKALCSIPSTTKKKKPQFQEDDNQQNSCQLKRLQMQSMSLQLTNALVFQSRTFYTAGGSGIRYLTVLLHQTSVQEFLTHLNVHLFLSRVNAVHLI
jgi:hypothetical protein